MPQFQPLVLSFLHDVLISSPALGHALICNLTVPNSPAHLLNNEALQLLYVKGIQGALETLTQLRVPEGGETTDSDSQYESDHTYPSLIHRTQSIAKECRRLTVLVYDLLSLMDTQPDMARVSVDKLFVCLLELCHRVGADLVVSFNAEKIYSCLLGRASTYLIERLHHAEDYIRMKVMGRGGGMGEKGVLASVQSFELLKRTSSPRDWRELFYFAHHDRRHFLESVLVREEREEEHG